MIQPTQQALDALHTALKLELDSAAFYQEAAKNAKNPLGKGTFESLIKEELGHIQMVKKAYTSITEANNWNEVEKNIPTKIDATTKTIFQIKKTELEQKLDPESDEMQALKTAMDIENEGYKFYEKMALETTDPIGKKMYEFLKDEENRHWELLNNTFEYLSDPALWFAKEEKHIYDGG
ncbi:MAG: ferritin family protein [bacterium]|nr:ferritin family protein [bacterium]